MTMFDPFPLTPMIPADPAGGQPAAAPAPAPAPAAGADDPYAQYQQLQKQIMQQQLGMMSKLPGMVGAQQGALTDLMKLYQQPQTGPDPALMQLAAGFFAPSRTGSFGENLSGAVSGYAGALSKQREAEFDKAAKLAQLKMTQAQLAAKLPEAQMEALKAAAGTAGSLAQLDERSRNLQLDKQRTAEIDKLVRSGQLSPEIARILPALSKEQQSEVLAKSVNKELSPGDREAVRNADDLVQTNADVITSLQEAKKLSGNAYSGFLAGQRATVAANLGDVGRRIGIDPERAGNTIALDNKVTQNALQQLRAVFGGNPTEGERAILLKIQGSANMTQREREAIYDEAIELAKKRLATNAQRSEELRKGTYYKPRTETSQSAATRSADSDPTIAAARDAIRKGADRAAVIQRLKDNGITVPGDL